MSNENSKPRDPVELEKLDSYADMTDEEINSLIQYKMQAAAINAAYVAQQDAIMKASLKQLDAQREALAVSTAYLNEKLNEPLKLTKIELED